MLAQLADLRMCALMSLRTYVPRPYVPWPLCPAPLCPVPLCPAPFCMSPYVGFRFKVQAQKQIFA